MTSLIQTVAASLALTIALAAGVRANEPVTPDQEKKLEETKPKAEVLKKEAAPTVEVTDAAKPLVEQIRAAYGKVASLEMAGTWAADWDIDGEQVKQSAEFTSSFAAPNKFRHETKNDLLFGSTGEKAYALERNRFQEAEAPKSRMAAADLPEFPGKLLKEKNPSLLLAVTADETPYLADRATKVDKGEDVKIGDTSFPSLKITTQPGEEVRVVIDPATGLIRQWSVDVRQPLTERGQPNVKTALLTIDYTTVKPDVTPSPDAFAWTPPAGAKDAAKMSDDPEKAALALEGKAAPPFELATLEGEKLKLESLKGQVVVLDFWASWCGPCRAGLPVLQQVAEARKEQGLKVYTINFEEDKETVAGFKKEMNLTLPILLDPNGQTSKAYHADLAIPLTVVIGKDGVVRKALVGAHERAELEKEIDAAMK